MPRKKGNGKRRLYKRQGNQMIRTGPGTLVAAGAGLYETGKKLWDATRETREYRAAQMAALRAHDRQAMMENAANFEGKRKIAKKPAAKPRSRGSVIIHGKTGGRFARARKTKNSKYNKLGVKLEYENRGSVNDGQCVYIGYGVPCQQAIDAVIFALVKRLFTDHGQVVENFDETIPSVTGQTYTITLNFFADNKATSTTSVSATIDYTTNKVSYAQMAGLLRDALDGYVTTAIAYQLIQWNRAYLQAKDSGATNSVLLASIPLDTTFLQIVYRGRIRLQNSTQSAGGTGDAKLSTDRIDVNPIRGKKYTSTKWTNTILPRNRDLVAIASYDALMVDSQTGLFSTTATDQAGTFSTLKGGMSVGFYKPPDPKTFINVKCAPVSIEPGEIKWDKQTFTCKLTWQSFFQRVMSQVADKTATNQVNFGKISMFALEHTLCQATESNVTVDYQHDWSIGCAMTYRKPYSVPVVRVQS